MQREAQRERARKACLGKGQECTEKGQELREDCTEKGQEREVKRKRTRIRRRVSEEGEKECRDKGHVSEIFPLWANGPCSISPLAPVILLSPIGYIYPPCIRLYVMSLSSSSLTLTSLGFHMVSEQQVLLILRFDIIF